MIPNESEFQPIKIVLIGGVLLGGIVWQIYLTFVKDKRFWISNCGTCKSTSEWWRHHSPRRIVIPFFFGLAVFLGFVGYQSLRAFDGKISPFQPPGEFNPAFWIPILKSLVFGFVLLLKTYFGPLVAGICVSWSLYHYFDYDELRLVPFLEAMLDWLFSACPQWLEFLYVVVVGVYSLGSAIRDSVSSVE